MTKKLLLIATLSLSAYGQDLPDSPSTSKLEFAAYAATDATTVALDMHYSLKFYSPAESRCHEFNPIYGRKPSEARYLGVAIPITIGANILSWELRKHHKDWYMLPQLADALAHGIGAMSGPHGGCLK